MVEWQSIYGPTSVELEQTWLVITPAELRALTVV